MRFSVLGGIDRERLLGKNFILKARRRYKEMEIQERVEVKATWRLAWGLFWRLFLIQLGISVVIGLIMFLVGISFLPWGMISP